jgi:hydrogenase maturation protease
MEQDRHGSCSCPGAEGAYSPLAADRAATSRTGGPRSGGRTLILGLGNPYLRDDSVGLRVAAVVEEAFTGCPDLEVRRASLAGFDLLDLLHGFERAIIVDSIRTEGGEPGSVYRLLPESLPVTERLGSMHEVNLSTAMALARQIGIEMPAEIVIYAVEIEDDRTFGETCTSEVEQAVGRVSAMVIQEAGEPAVQDSRGI